MRQPPANGTYNQEHVKAILMSSKFKAKWSAIVAAITGFLAIVNEIPISLQDKFIQALQAIFPVAWRPEIVVIGAFVACCALIYATVHSAKSGPQTPPANPPNS